MKPAGARNSRRCLGTSRTASICVLGLSCVGAGVVASLLTGCEGRASAGGRLETLVVIGESGKQPGQFGHPRCLDTDGVHLWVCDRLARVQRIDPQTGKSLEVWRTPKHDRGMPTGITIWKSADPSGLTLLFIADTHEARVLVYAVAIEGAPTLRDVDGRPPLLASIGSFGEAPGQFIYPTDIAVRSDASGRRIERLYVSEYGGNDRITIFEPGGEAWQPALETPGVAWGVVRTFGAFGMGKDEFNRPQSLALWNGPDGKAHTGDDALIVADACNQRVGVFSLEGELVRWHGAGGGDAYGATSSDQPGGFSYPYGVWVLEDGTALVSEFGNNRVQRIDLETGSCLGLFGEGGRGPGQVVTPWAAVALGDRAWILDSGNARLQAIALPSGRREVRASSDGEGR